MVRHIKSRTRSSEYAVLCDDRETLEFGLDGITIELHRRFEKVGNDQNIDLDKVDPLISKQETKFQIGVLLKNEPGTATFPQAIPEDEKVRFDGFEEIFFHKR